jgi:hypothetical protein
MGPAFLVLAIVVFLVGAPLLIGAVVIGLWLRRSNRTCALRTYLGAALSGTVAFLSFFGAIATLIAIGMHEKRHPEYFETHPAAPLLMIGLALLAFAAGLACAFFGVWTLWRLIEAPPAQPVRTTPAT